MHTGDKKDVLLHLRLHICTHADLIYNLTSLCLPLILVTRVMGHKRPVVREKSGSMKLSEKLTETRGMGLLDLSREQTGTMISCVCGAGRNETRESHLETGTS